MKTQKPSVHPKEILETWRKFGKQNGAGYDEYIMDKLVFESFDEAKMEATFSIIADQRLCNVGKR